MKERMALKRNWLLGLPFLLGLVMLLTPYLLAPVCTGLVEMKSGAMNFMKCHYTAQGELVLGALILGTGLLLFKPRTDKRLLGAVVAFIGLATIVMPQQWVIGICLKDTMACHTTAKWLYTEGFLTMAAGVGIWTGWIKEGADCSYSHGETLPDEKAKL